jgi:small subunit ribosomal protein S33
MSTVKKSILKLYPQLRNKIQAVREEVLGWSPPSLNNMRTGKRFARQQLDAVYLNQYYTETESIDVAARKVIRGWKNEKEERRAAKLVLLRRRGKGPPKKGAGKQKTMKKK